MWWGGGGDVLMFHAITISFLFSNCGSQTSASENGTSQFEEADY